MEKILKVGKIFRKSLVENVRTGVENSKSVFLIHYSSVSSSQMDELRKNLRKAGAKVYVSKNRIAKIALEELKHGDLIPHLKGQTAFAWSNEDSAEISKILMKFAKACEGLSVTGGLLDGAVLKKADVQRLAELPSKDILRAQLLATMVSPISRLAGALNAKTRDLLSILKQLSEKKEGGK